MDPGGGPEKGGETEYPKKTKRQSGGKSNAQCGWRPHRIILMPPRKKGRLWERGRLGDFGYLAPGRRISHENEQTR